MSSCPSPPHHVVESITITGALHYCDMTLPFVDGLLTLIGGRGSGKSGTFHLVY